MTRVMSLQAGQPSGVDRVCLAYLRAFCASNVPCFGLVRTRLGYILLDDKGAKQMLKRLEREVPWGKPDALSIMLHKQGSYKRVTEAELRRFCIARCRPNGLPKMLRKHLPEGVVYVNVDHANATERVLWSVKSVPEARVTFFLHDTIPLDFPEYQTSKSIQKFDRLLDRVSRFADLILCNSEVSKQDIQRNLDARGNVPPIHVAHLGVEEDFVSIENNHQLPEGVKSPFFIVVGTIEPRKNIGFLLRLWDEIVTEADVESTPQLVICGRRGWMDEEVFAALDTSPLKGRLLHEFNDLDDQGIKVLIQNATGLLFPSFVEGFGLPPVEAAAMGVPVICNDLPVLHEILNEYPVYASVTDSYAWKKNILELTRLRQDDSANNVYVAPKFAPPSWESHFNAVLKLT